MWLFFQMADSNKSHDNMCKANIHGLNVVFSSWKMIHFVASLQDSVT